jgi:hypothetical protein
MGSADSSAAGGRPGARPERKPRLLIAGATGVLGNEVLRRWSARRAFASTQVLAREPVKAGLRGVMATQVPRNRPATGSAARPTSA